MRRGAFKSWITWAATRLNQISNYTAALLGSVLLTSVILMLWMTHVRVSALEEQERRLATLAVDGIARDIQAELQDLTRSLNLFAQNRREMLIRLAEHPDDTALFDQLVHEIRLLFPKAFAATLADAQGRPLIEDFDGLVEEVCVRSIVAFAAGGNVQPAIHPNPAGYHFDLMTRVSLDAHGEAVFFVSFRPEAITPLLGAHHLPHYQLLLVHRDIPGLIEIGEGGSREALQRALYLTEPERDGITAHASVPGTRWDLIALPRTDTTNHSLAELWRKTAWEITALMLVGVTAVWQLRRTTRREQAQHRLLSAISNAESQFIAESDPHEVFDGVLTDLLALSESEYGFIGEVLYTPEGVPYLKSYAITNIAWNEETHRLYDEHASRGMEFHNLDTLFGSVIKSGKLIISNLPETDPRAGGIPRGHPPLRAFLGAPLYHGQELVGMIGLANRASGYDARLVEFLDPMIRSCANLFGAMRTARERSRTESALRDSETRQRATFDTVVDGIITMEESGRLESYNAAAERIFGYAADEVIGQGLHMLMPPAEHGHPAIWAAEHLHHVLKSGIGHVHETQGRRKDGSLFPMEITLSEMQLETERRYVGVFRDITLRKQAERRLHETLALQRAILDSTVYSIIATDRQGTILVFNPGAEHMLGYRADEMIGKQTPEIIHDAGEVRDRAAALSAELGQHITPGFDVFVAKANLGGADEREWTYVRKDGSRLSVLLSVTALRDEQGMVTGFLGIANDITERKKVDTMKNEFVSTVSHELRTPLTSIRGSLGLVIGGTCGEVSEKMRPLLEIAANNSDRLVRLINDILDIEKIESGSMKFDLHPQPIGPIIAQSLQTAAGYAQQYDVRFELTRPVPDAEVMIDGDRMIQVMLNLLSNAAKFSPRGSTVEVDAGIDDEQLCVSVSDRGEGIPDEFKGRIFQKFAQADGSDSRRKGGTGLGLSICKAILDKHRGQIGFESHSGKGTRFFFQLPLHSSAQGRQQLHASADGVVWLGEPLDRGHLPTAIRTSARRPDRRQTRLLHVEDDTDIAKVVKTLLGHEIDVVHAAGLQAAHDHLERESFDLILLDIGLDDGSGLTLIPFVRRLQPPIPVVIFSGQELEDDLLEDVHAALVKSRTTNGKLLDTIHHVISTNTPETPQRLAPANDSLGTPR